MEPDELPGAGDEPDIKSLLHGFSIGLMKITLPDVPDEELTEFLAVFHDEWERRHGERWIIPA